MLPGQNGALPFAELLETESFVFQNARLFMFANVNICKSRCWAPADWGSPEGLEEALFTCSEECYPARTLLYLPRTQGHSAGRDGPALSLPKVSTSQYQQQNTMWVTWEKEMKFQLMLLQCSETQVQWPLLPLISLGEGWSLLWFWLEKYNRFTFICIFFLYIYFGKSFALLLFTTRDLLSLTQT